MSLINYTNLEDGQKVTANIFNERYGQIVTVLNGGLDSSNFSTGGIPAAALATDVFEKIYPVGSLYFNAINSANPSELLGFGTWVAFGAGKVPVGYDSTDTDFNAAEKTGGEKTHALTEAELASHGHVISTDGAHTHSLSLDGVATAGFGVQRTYLGGGSGQQLQWNGALYAGSAGSHSHTVNNTGSGTAHNNLPPFITVYCWKRTA